MLAKLIDFIISTYIVTLLFHIWFQWVKCSLHSSISQYTNKVTKFLLKPLMIIFPSLGLDSLSLLLAIIISIIKFPILLIIQEHIFLFNRVFLIAGILSLIKTAGTLVFWIIAIRLITSWIKLESNMTDHVLIQLTEPLISQVRRIIPNIMIGNFDCTSIVIMIILYLLNYLGASLFPNIWFQI